MSFVIEVCCLIISKWFMWWLGTEEATSHRLQQWRSSSMKQMCHQASGLQYDISLSVCLFVSLLNHFWIIHLFKLHLLYQPYVCRPLSSYMCSITPEIANVGSSYSHMRGPGVGCWLSDRSNCSHWSFECCRLTLTFTLTSENLSLYITLLL